jgi:hypothetical protein
MICFIDRDEYMKLVCMLGCIGSGKSFWSDFLVGKGFANINFADALRKLVYNVVGVYPKNEIEYTDFKFRVFSDGETSFNGRELLQRIGTGVREYQQDFWIDAFKKGVVSSIQNGVKNIVCSDCRFPNEVTAVIDLGKEYGIDVVFQYCEYRSDRFDPENKHESERLAQMMLRSGKFKDRQEITQDEMIEFLKCSSPS